MKLLSAIALIGLSNTIHAQTDSSTIQFGVKGGVNFSNIYNEEVDDNNVLTSFNAGIYASFPITDLIAIQPEILYSQKGAELKYDNAFATGEAKFKLNYIEVPVLVKFNLTENLNIHAGPYVAYLVDAQVKNNSEGGSFNFEDNYNNDDFNKFDAGLSGGIGLEFNSVGFGARYNYGLSKIGKEKEIAGTTYTTSEGKNSNLSIYATFRIN
ncbi:porin family protein [Flavobacterium sp. WC2509]|uniref:porin family protein n=1 Tax=Flavobacterium sp. WC2509 TaxID=3461406 RepID=UPI004043BD7B